ncbi:MAG TPA: complex I NDUFA9 subunit family protein [Sphingomonas sp.]|uniref:complex I NDUFA9 subunit family protein n=1 Tax=Sphingomonas sp. TaxID=28214 RepID=UPI002CA5287F|nr:complex I NDUFA9 subunit family protein [Sphingomonas sp.]HMI20091.1 complex I NDUFA9 subunit family protein [Sphingomonas sp.]
MDELVVLFGGGGFLGRYVAQELLRSGARVRIAERDPLDAFFLKPLAPLGQVQSIRADITKPETLAAAVHGATAVVNLVGLLKGKFQAVHVDGAANVAKAAAAAGVQRLVQISAIGADPAAESAYARTKGEGEQAVRAAFPGATIIRPSILFGPEDGFVNKFAGLISRAPVLPVIRPNVRFQPAWVVDVARAVGKAALSPALAGKRFELGGPQVLSMLELHHWIADAIAHKPSFVAVPDPVAAAMARFGFLPGAPITWDQWLMLQHDNVVADGAKGFSALGIAPTPLAAVAPSWLVRYRRHGRFSLTAA